MRVWSVGLRCVLFRSTVFCTFSGACTPKTKAKAAIKDYHSTSWRWLVMLRGMCFIIKVMMSVLVNCSP